MNEAKLSPISFDGTNYLQWRERAKAYLMTKSCWKYVCKSPVEPLEESESESHEKARSMLLLLLSDCVMRRYTKIKIFGLLYMKLMPS